MIYELKSIPLVKKNLQIESFENLLILFFLTVLPDGSTKSYLPSNTHTHTQTHARSYSFVTTNVLGIKNINDNYKMM